MNEFRSLIDFFRWFRCQALEDLCILNDAGTEFIFGKMIIHGMVLCRRPPYQVELFVGYGPGTVPEHAHPNVSSIEVALSGGIRFLVEDRVVLSGKMLETDANGAMRGKGAIVRIREGIRHGAVVEAKGAAFLSVQRWLNGAEPSSVALDWEGPAFARR